MLSHRFPARARTQTQLLSCFFLLLYFAVFCFGLLVLFFGVVSFALFRLHNMEPRLHAILTMVSVGLGAFEFIALQAKLR